MRHAEWGDLRQIPPRSVHKVQSKSQSVTWPWHGGEGAVVTAADLSDMPSTALVPAPRRAGRGEAQVGARSRWRREARASGGRRAGCCWSKE